MSRLWVTPAESAIRRVPNSDPRTSLKCAATTGGGTQRRGSEAEHGTLYGNTSHAVIHPCEVYLTDRHRNSPARRLLGYRAQRAQQLDALATAAESLHRHSRLVLSMHVPTPSHVAASRWAGGRWPRYAKGWRSCAAQRDEQQRTRSPLLSRFARRHHCPEGPSRDDAPGGQWVGGWERRHDLWPVFWTSPRCPTQCRHLLPCASTLVPLLMRIGRKPTLCLRVSGSRHASAQI